MLKQISATVISMEASATNGPHTPECGLLHYEHKDSCSLRWAVSAYIAAQDAAQFLK